jgi:DNA repair exonuclease SbcCD ATPase subunit
VRIISVELKNFCQHADKLVEFSSGLNAIVGSNGAGKSTILNAIGFCLTGVISVAGVKADNIRQQANKSAKSYAKLVFQHADMTVTVQRNLRPKTPNAVMTINGGAELVGEAIVDAELVRILGVPQDVITNMVVVGHGDLFGFLQQTQGARLEQFQKLFRLEQAAKLYDGIGKYLSAMTIPVITESVAELQIQAAQEQAELDTLETQLADPAMDVAATQQSIDECQHILQLATQVQQRKQQLAASRQSLEQLQEVRRQTDVRYQCSTVAYTRLQAEYAKEDYAAAGAAVAGWNAYQSAVQVVAAAKKRVEEADRELGLAQADVTPVDAERLLSPDEIVKAQEQLTAWQVRILRLTDTQNLVPGQACPTCGTAAVDLEARQREAAEELAMLRLKVGAVLPRVQYSECHYISVERHNMQLATLQAEYAAALAAMQAIPPIVEVQSCEAAQATLQLGARLTAQMGVESRNVNALAAQLASIDGQIQQLNIQIATQVAILDASRQDTPESVAMAASDLENWKAVLKVLQECEVKRATLRERVSSTRQRISRLEIATKQVQVTTKLRDLLTGVRGVFHKEAAPALVIQANLHRLQSEINRQLTLFDADYRVQVAEGASFTAMFEGGIVQPVQRLSYGQQVALAFAFRLALNRTIIPQVNGLCLDEPTAYLDRRRIDAFAPVFEQLRQAAQATGFQCIIVTHERLLSHLFDNVIEV